MNSIIRFQEMWSNLKSTFQVLIVFVPTLLIVIISSSYLSLSSIQPIGAISGVIALIVVPGLIVNHIFLKSNVTSWWIVFLSGLAYQLFIFQTLFIISLLFEVVLPVQLIIIFLTSVLVLGYSAFIYVTKRANYFDFHLEVPGGKKIVVLLILAVFIRLSLSLLANSNIAPDAALYSDYARNIINGEFRSNVLNDHRIYNLWNGMHYCHHQAFIYLAALSWILVVPGISGPTLILNLTGVALVGTTYSFGEHFFGKNSAFCLAVILAVHPLFLFHSSIAYGPEMTSLFFVIGTFTIILTENVSNYRIWGYTGILFSFSDLIWYPNFMLFAVSLPFFLFLSGLVQRNQAILLSVGVLTLLTIRIFILNLMYLGILILIFLLFASMTFAFVSKLCARRILTLLGSAIAIQIIWRWPTQLMSFMSSVHAISTHPARLLIQAPNPDLSIFLATITPELLLRFLFYIVYHTSPLLLTLVPISIFFSNSKRLCIALIAVAFIGSIGTLFLFAAFFGFKEPLTQVYLYSDSRFFLSIVISLILSLGTLFERLHSMELDEKISNIISRASRKKWVTPSILVIILVGLIPSYGGIPSGLALIDIEERYGWIGLRNDVDSIVSQQAIILADRAPELSWLTERQSVQFSLPDRQMSFAESLSLVKAQSNTYGITHYLIDWYTIANWWTLESLLNIPLNIGGGVPVDIRKLDYTANESRVHSLVLEYQTEPNQEGNYARLYSFESLYFKRDTMVNLTNNGWAAGNNGNLTQAGGYPAIEIGGNENYTFTYRPSGFDLGLTATSGFLFLDFQEISAEVSRIEFYNTSGDFIGYSTELGNGLHFHFVGDSILGDIRIIVEGNPGGYVIVEGISVWGTG